MLYPGVILQQRYRIKRLLARGGMGAVYEAEAVHLRNAIVAVKETFFSEDRQSLREQFEREAATLARLRHPALPQVKDHFIEGGGQFLVMDFIEGEDLGMLLGQRLNKRREPFEFWQVMEWAERLLDALGYIHGQYPPVIHRDIKPQNLKLTPRGELFLIDFGLAKDETTPTRPGHSVHGFTLEFAPPEQIKGEGTDARSDIYSLGATLYHLATGKLPPDARIREEAVIRRLMPDLLEPAHQVNPNIPPAFASALARAMTLKRELRYQSAQEMRQELWRITQDIEAAIAENERQEAERRRLEEESRQRELEWQRQREEAARAQALQDAISTEEGDPAKPRQALPHEPVTGRIGMQSVAHGRPIDQFDQESAAPEPSPAALAARRKAPRVALIVTAASLLIVLLAYMSWTPANSANDKAAGATPQATATPTNDKAAGANTPTGAGVESSPTPSPSPSYEVLPAGIKMVYVPDGSFMMGSPAGEPGSRDDESPQHSVNVRSFYIGKYEVTRAQWHAVMGGNPPELKGGDFPVTNITWHEAKDFCGRLSRATGHEYRLPTEAEWEYACRAGTTGAYAGNLRDMAWYFHNSLGKLSHYSVGGKKPNKFGIHDMQGNVSEWCEDYWHYDYKGAPTDGSAWTDNSGGGSRVTRGCDWTGFTSMCRSASRDDWYAGSRSDNLGFRIVRTYR